MELLNAIELDRASRRHPQIEGWLTGWRTVVQDATWHDIEELRLSHPAADGVPLGQGRNRMIVTVFNAGGNDFRLLTRINYARQLVQVEAVLTHAEYSKNKWKRRYE